MHLKTWPKLPVPHPNLRISVVLPVRNESARLEQALKALADQQCLSGTPFECSRYEVLLLANNCEDDSAAIARSFAGRHRALQLHIAEVQLPPQLANIGHVRRVLMDLACQRLGAAGHADAWIASTDADSVVAPDWLARTERELAAGAHAVGGRIRLDPGCPVQGRTLRYQRLDAAFRLARSRLEDLLDPDPVDPWPRHHQHFCASLAVTRSAYLQVGGLPQVTYLEDQALVDVLRKRDLSVRHSPHVQVMTSGRQDGRAEVGLAWQLRQWSHSDEPANDLMVERVDDWLERVQAKRELRLLWQSANGLAMETAPHTLPQWSDVAKRLGVSQSWLMRRTASATFFGTLWDEVQAPGEHRAATPCMTVRAAIQQIRTLVSAQLALGAVRSSTSIR